MPRPKAGAWCGAGTRRCKCKERGIYYTVDPKRHAYPEETRELAIKMYYGGVSGRGVGKILGMNKSDVANWIKKSAKNDVEKCKTLCAPETVELDELYWFLERKPRAETREKIHIMTPSQWKASTLTCGIISRIWHGAAGAFPESWKTFRPFLLFSFALITASARRKVVTAPPPPLETPCFYPLFLI